MKNLFVPITESLELRELGFDEPCLYVYYENKLVFYFKFRGIKNSNKISHKWVCTAPQYQQVFEFFRETHGFYINDFVDDDKTFGYMISYFTESGRVDKPIQRKYSTYPESQLACINQLIEIIKNK
jgi:hypothetical protein